MMTYLDSSVVLRKLFAEPNSLEWSQIVQTCSCRFLLVEVGRVIDRYRLLGKIDDAQVADLHQEFQKILRSIDIASISERVLLRAAGPMPVALGTLDSIHLAAALEIAHEIGSPVMLATHDVQLGRAARASGLEVVGA
jgi:predicted nucleic acid-binding protein